MHEADALTCLHPTRRVRNASTSSPHELTDERSRVKEVTSDSVTYLDRTTGKDVTIPAGFVLWSTGISMNPLTKTVASRLPNQYHKHALEVDSQCVASPLMAGTEG